MRAVLVALMLLGMTHTAMARPQLRDSYPKHGAHLMFHKPVVGLEFTDPLVEASVKIIDPRGRDIVKGEPEILAADPANVMIDIRAFETIGLIPGEYVVTWKIKTQSGETATDSFNFHVMRH